MQKLLLLARGTRSMEISIAKSIMHACCLDACIFFKKKNFMCVMSYRLHSAVRGSTELVKIENVESLKSEKEEKEEV